MSEREKWVPVQSEDELRVGMVVKITPCIFCMGTHVVTLTDRSKAKGTMHTPDRGVVSHRHKWSWRTAPNLACAFPRRTIFGTAIDQRRLYRLETGVDDSEAQREGREIYAPRKIGSEVVTPLTPASTGR